MIHSPFDNTIPILSYHTYADPAAGAEEGLAALDYRISAASNLSFLFEADANAASRMIYITYYTGLVNYHLGSASFNLTANQDRLFICNSNSRATSAANTDFHTIHIPFLPIWTRFDQLYIRCLNMQVGDQISDIHVIWSSWPYKTS